MPGLFFLGELLRIILCRLIPRNGKAFPPVIFDHLRYEDDLPYVIWIVCELPVNGFKNCVAVVPDIDGLVKITIGNTVQCVK